MDNAGLEPKSRLPPSMCQLLRGDQIAVILRVRPKHSKGELWGCIPSQGPPRMGS